MSNKKRSTITKHLEEIVASEPISGKEEQRRQMLMSRDEITASLQDIVNGGTGTPSRRNQAYAAHTEQRQAAREQARWDAYVQQHAGVMRAQQIYARKLEQQQFQNAHRQSQYRRQGVIDRSRQMAAENPEQMARWLRMDADAYERKANDAQRSTRPEPMSTILPTSAKWFPTYDRFGRDTGYLGEDAGEYAAQQSLAKEYQSRADAARAQSREVSTYGEQYRRQQQEAARAEQIAEDPAAWMRWAQQQSRAARQRWESRGTDGAYNGITDGIGGGGAQTAADNAAYDEYQRQLKEADDIYRQAYAALREQEAAGQVPTQFSGDAPSAHYRTVNGQRGEAQPRIIGSRAEGNAGTAAITGQRAEAYMSDEQRQTYNYLYATQGKGAAEEYYKLIEPELEQARTQGTQQEFAELSERAPAAMTLLSTLASPAKIAAGLTSVGDALAGDEINTDSAFYTPVHAISAIRQTVPQVTNWTGDKQIFGQDADSFIYGVITSSLDSALNMALATGLGGIAGGAAGLTEGATNSLIANATSALMGAEMLPDTVMEEKAKGRTDEEATAIAIIRSLIEGVTEKYSIEYFLGDPTTFGKKLGKAFLAEGSEEVASNWLNNIVDVVSSDPENVLQQWRDRVDSGENGALAFAEVVGGMLSEDAASFIAGGISGLGMGAVHEGIQRAGQDKQAYRLGALGQSDAQAVVDEALAINPDSKAAQRAKARLDAGKNVRSVQLGRIMAESDAAILPQEQALAEASKKYGKQAGAMQATYDGEQDVQRYDEAYHVAYEMGRAGTNLKAAQTSMATGYLSQEQRQAAWEAGRDSAGAGSAADIANGRALLGGQIAAVQSISERDGKVYAEILQGTETKRVALEDLKMDAGTKMLAESAKQYGAAAPTIFEQYRKGQQLTQYLRSADMAVSVGMASPSASAETVLANLKSGQLGKVMAAEQIEALYKAGQQAGKAQLRKTGMTRLGTGSFTLEDSAKGTKLDKRQRAALRFLRDLARVTGLDISVYKSASGADGTLMGANGSYVDGRIRVDLNAGAIYDGKLEDASMLRTVAHELTHFMAEAAEAEFKELQSFLVEKLSAWEGHSIQDLVDEKLALSKSHGRDISTEEALEEVVADGCEMMLRDSKAVQQLAEENRTLFEKVRDWMTRFFDALRKAFEGVEAVHPESIHMMENYAEELQKLWDEALTAAVQNAKESGQKNSAPVGVDAAYSERYHSSEVNDDLLALIDRVASGNFRANERVYFGIVSDDIAAQIFAKTKIRVNGFRMAIEARQIEHILKDHGKNGKTDRSMKDWTDIARMEYALRNPDSLTNAGRTQAYTYMKYGYNRTAPTVLYEKRIGEKSYYVVQAVPDTTARTLFVVTAFIGKSANKNGASQLIDVIDVNYPNATPENGSASAPNSTIAQNKGGSQEEKFSLRGSVEETRDLIAVHNLTEENLVSSLDIGGLPSPSIAIIKAEQGHSKYGPISIVFDKSTIDPQADSRNKIYGSDAWTPTVPRVEYQVNSKMLSQIERELHRLAGDTSVAGGIFGNSSALRSMGIDDTSNLNRKQLAEKLASTDTVRAAYLADQGQTLEPVKMDKVWDKFGNDTLQKVIDRLGVDTLAEMEANLEVGESAENALGENAEVIRDILRDYYRKQGEPMLRRMAVKKHWTAAEISEKRQTRIDNSIANVSVFTLEDIVRHAWEMYQDGGSTKGEIDRLATSEALRSAVDDHAVEEWIAGKLDGLLGKAGIYNGKDRYTPSGNSRSFAQLHYDYTLENIVRAMNGLQQARGEGIWGASAESFVAVGTPDYRSIDEVRADKGRLREATEEEYDALKAKLDPMIEEIITGVRNGNKAHSDNQFEEIDIIGSLLLDAAKGTKTKAAIRSVFRKNGYTISDALIARAQSLYSEAAKMPTKYFEAKPQRAVSFDEAKAIIVPDNTSAALVQRLEQGGANVISYKAGDEQARLEALNAQEGVKFSERDSTPNVFNPDGKTIDEQLDDVLNTAESFDGRYLYIGRFTQEFVELVKPYLEVRDLPIVMNYRDAYLAMESRENGRYHGDGINYHKLGKEGLKHAIEFFASPDAIMLSKKDGKIELVLDGTDYKGDRILAIVALNTVTRNANRFVEAHIATSIYGRRSIENYIRNAAKDKRLIYDKREEPTQGISQVQYESNINADSSLNPNVAQNDPTVKRQERDITITPAEILDEINLDAVKGTAAYDALRDYKNALTEREDIRQKLEEQRNLSQNGTGGEARKAKNRAGIYQTQFDRADTKVKQLRRNKALRQLVESEMTYVSGRQDAANQTGAVQGRYTDRFEQRLEQGYQINRIVQDKYDTMVESYGAIPQGENASRTVSVPQRTEKGNRVSQTVRTAMEAQATTDEGVRALKKAVVDGNFSYLPITDKAAGSKALQTIKDKGYQKALADWTVSMSKGHPGKNDVALGFQLYNQALNSGDTKTAVQVLSDLASRVREGAQMVQAVRMLKKLSPDNQLYSVQLSLKALQEDVDERYGKKAPKLKLNEALVNNFLEAENEAQKEAAQKAIYRDIASQLPHTFMDRWNSWRYLCMLGNVRTHVRNILGNAGFVPVRRMKDAVALGIETAYSKAKGGNVERSKGFVSPNSDLYKLAKADYENIADLITGGGKYNDAASGIESMKSAFGEKGVWKYLSKIADANSFALDAEDVWFSKPAYAQSLAGYLKANKVTTEQFNADEAIRDKARAYAVKEAQRATYRDYNDFSNFIAKIGRTKRGGGTTAKVASTLMEGVLPFRRTPANILARGMEYSPGGLLIELLLLKHNVKTGKYTAAQAIDRISAGLTGTGLMALGYFLAKIGWLVPPDDDDDKQAGFDKLRGAQSYALKIGKTYVTVDWLAPEALPVFVGSQCCKLRSDGWGNNGFIKSFYHALSNISEPMLEMSMLSSLQDVIENVSYADGQLMAILSTAATNYLTQAFPTLAGQIERITESERETTFATDDSPLTKDLQYILAKIMNKTPGEFQQIPYIDAWGRHEDTGTVLARAFNNLLNPAYLSYDKSEPFEDELQRLYDLGYSDLLPQRVKQSQKVEGETLTQEEYVAFAETKGKTQYEALKGIIDSSWYEDLSDAARGELLGMAYSYADGMARLEVNENADVSKWILETKAAVEDGGKLSEILRDRLDEDVIDFQTAYPQYADLGDNKIHGYLEYCEPAGVPLDTVYNAAQTCKDFEGEKDSDGKTISGSVKAQVVEYIQSLGLNRTQAKALWDALKGDWKDEDTPWA